MDRDAVNHHSRTRIHLTAMYGRLNAPLLLLEHHAKLDLRDRWGATALSIAQSNENFDVAIALIEAGARIDTQTNNIQRLFFAAVERGSVKAVEILIDLGADVLTKDTDGRRAWQLARQADDVEMIQLLKKPIKSFPYQPAEAQSERREDTVSSTDLFQYVVSWAEQLFS
ncbi:Ankyrin-3 [Acarospora aff. strigata]|nr:Ankyrin-3 [Acarospora aff. strigata]